MTPQSLDKQPKDLAILQFAAGDSWPKVLNSRKALHTEVLKAGPILSGDFSLAMEHLAAIVRKDRAAGTDMQRMRTAVAVSMELASKYAKRNPQEAVDRYLWYRDAQESGKLHPSFDSLATWERRFVVNLPWHHGNGSNEELDWLNSEVKLPPMDYRGACWQAPYRGHNAFGITVQGPLYYAPFENDLQAFEMRRTVGGVCGGLSHYGAAAARANGIGALTMGEPGHCAYAIRIEGKWHPSYSLSSRRGPHQTLLRKSWPYVELQEQVFKDPESTLLGARRSGWASMLSKVDTRQAALVAIQACNAQPNNPFLWEQRFQLLQAAGLDKPDKWIRQATLLGQAMQGFPSVAVETLKQLDLTQGSLSDPKLRSQMVVGALGESMGENSPVAPAMDWTRMFDSVYGITGDDPVSQRNACLQMAEVLSKGPDADKFVADALTRFQDDEKTVGSVMDLVLSGIGSKSRGKVSDDQAVRLAKLVESCMASAGIRRECESFQQFAAMHPKPYKAGLKKPDGKSPGKLVSAGGSVRFSSLSSRYDTPNGHAGLLTLSGGKFHSNSSDTEWIEVTFPKVSQINAIVIDNAKSHHGRAVPLTIEVSVDGEEWTEIERIEKASAQWQIDLRNQPPTARFLRINGAVGRADFLHLSRILVYGKAKS